MEVEFDTVANNFNITSGTTGEALAANSAVGVPNVQSASSIAVGRYNLQMLVHWTRPMTRPMLSIKLEMDKYYHGLSQRWSRRVHRTNRFSLKTGSF